MSTTMAAGVTLFGFALTGTAIRPAHAAHPPTQQDWEQLGEVLWWFEDSIQWLIGAWVTYGEDHFGERASQAMNATGWKKGTVSQCVWVHTQVSESRRLSDLSWSHHREVADLQPVQQTVWLTRAKQEDWSVAELRRAISRETAPEKAACWLLVRCISEVDRDALATRLEGEGRSVKRP